jgi:hypothetical protein
MKPTSVTTAMSANKVIRLIWAMVALAIAVSIALPVLVTIVKALSWIILVVIAVVAARFAFRTYMDNR